MKCNGKLQRVIHFIRCLFFRNFKKKQETKIEIFNNSHSIFSCKTVRGNPEHSQRGANDK